MIALTKYDNADAAIIKLLRSLKIAVDPEIIIAELEKHPDYPSLLAISDVLTVFNVENVALRVNFNELGDVTVPFLAHTNGGDMVLVKKAEKAYYHLSSDKWNNHKVNADEFKKMYNGVVLTAAPSVETESPAKISFLLKQIKTPSMFACTLLILASALLFHTGYISRIDLPLALLTLFKTIGLITSLLLLIQSIDSNNPLVQVVCQTRGKTDCNAILSSKAAKLQIAEGVQLSWSEVGFFYFAGTWLLLLFGGNSHVEWQIIALLNFISLPYTVYSIYYQGRVAKQWCVLCCTIQAVLWLEFICIVRQNFRSFGEGSGGAATLSTIFICLVLPFVLWLSLKPLFLKLQMLGPLKQQLRKFKYNAELFNKMLTEQPKYAQPDTNWSIVLGNAGAENIVTMVSSPYCPPCSKTHEQLDDLLKERSDVQARIVFTANNDERDRNTLISRHLMALNDVADKATVKKALHDWYEQKQKNYEAWASIYPVELEQSGFYKIDKQHDWCQMAEVTATPTLLLNGYRLPGLYQLSDLKYMIE